MPPLNAIDAISPAWQHTQQLLLARRDWRVLFKVALVAIFAQIGGCNAGFNGPNFLAGHSHGSALAIIIVAGIILALLGLAVWLAFFYLTSRLQLALFDIVLRRNTAVSPAWSRYGPVAWRWVGAKIVVGLTALLCAAPFFVPALIYFIRFVTRHPTNDAGPGPFFVMFVIFAGGIVILALAIGVSLCLLHDFGLPSLALEGTPLRETIHRIAVLVRSEPLQVFLYLVMRFLLSLAGAITCYLALIFASLVALIPLGGLAALLYFGLHRGGAAATVFIAMVWVVLGLVFLALFLAAAVALFGYMFTFFQAYAIYFLASRYPLLDSILHPAPPAPPPYLPEPPPIPLQA